MRRINRILLSNLFGEYNFEKDTYENKLLGCESEDWVLLIHEKKSEHKNIML